MDTTQESISSFVEEVHTLSVAIARPAITRAAKAVADRHDFTSLPISFSAIRRRIEKSSTLVIDRHLINLLSHDQLVSLLIQTAKQRDAAITEAAESKQELAELRSEMNAVG